MRNTFDKKMTTRATTEDESSVLTHQSKDGRFCYQISIIDYLQTFDRGKKNEVLAKKYFRNADPVKLSAVPS